MNKLEEHFHLISIEDNLWKSRKKHRGVSPSDDKHLFVHQESDYTHIYWGTINGLEITIFEGCVSDENLDTLFEWLQIKSYNLW